MSKRRILGIVLIAIFLLLIVLYQKFSGRQGEATVSGVVLAEQDCYEGGKAEKMWKVCLHKAKSGVSADVVFFLHGRDLDERSWNDVSYYPAQIQKFWQEERITPPAVASVSFGPLWILAERSDNSRSGLYEIFLSEVVPSVEARIGRPARKMVIGESMGGFNGLQLALKTRGVFARVASLCPPISPVSPFAPLGEKWAYIQRSGADVKTMIGVMTIAQKFFATEEGWKKVSPLDLVEKVDPEHAPELYLSCGLYDKYGNYEGVERLVSRARAKGMRVEWHPLYGGHCAIDIPSVARFLTR